MKPSLVRETVTEQLPNLPALSGNKTSRVVTKHFTNLAMFLQADELALLNWMIYQCHADNTIDYRQSMLERYGRTIAELHNEYNGVQVAGKFMHYDLKVSPRTVREVMIRLIKKGYVLSDGLIMMVNPMLTYRGDYVSRAEYESLCNSYQEVCDNGYDDRLLRKFMDHYRKIIKG